MRLISFAGIEFTGLDSAYNMSVIAETAEMRIAGQNGAYDLLGSGSQFGNQSYSAEFTIMPDCTAATKYVIDQLRGAMQTTGDLIAEFESGSRRRTTARLVSVRSEPNFNDIRAGIDRVKCEFRANPFWYEDALTVIEPVAATTMLAVNGGNAVSRNIKFTISPTANVANLTLTAGDVSLVYGAGLLTTDVLAIDAMAGTVTKNGVNVYGNTARPDTQMALFELVTGENEIELTHPVTGRVEYRGCWV